MCKETERCANILHFRHSNRSPGLRLLEVGLDVIGWWLELSRSPSTSVSRPPRSYLPHLHNLGSQSIGLSLRLVPLLDPTSTSSLLLDRHHGSRNPRSPYDEHQTSHTI